MSQTPARAQPQSNGLHPQVRDFFQAASDTYHSHEALQASNADLTSRIAVAEGMIAHLRTMLAQVTEDRDYHMQHAFALASGINAAQDVLNGVFELAKRQAARLPEAPQLEMPGAGHE